MTKVDKAFSPEEVDKRIGLWHDMPEDEWKSLGYPPLHVYLGWTETEYIVWFEKSQLPKE